MWLFADGSVYVDSRRVSFTVPHAASIDAFTDHRAVIRSCPVNSPVRFVVVDLMIDSVVGEFFCHSTPKQVFGVQDKLFICSKTPVSVIHEEISNKKEDDDDFSITSIDIRNNTLQRFTSPHAVLTSAGPIIGLQYFVESLAVISALADGQLKHTTSLPGISYIAGSRQNLKFFAVSETGNLTAMCEAIGGVTVFKRPLPGAQTSESIVLQDHGHDELIMGIALSENAVAVLSQKSLFFYEL